LVISLVYPSGEEGGFYWFELFLPAFATLRGRGGSTLWPALGGGGGFEILVKDFFLKVGKMAEVSFYLAHSSKGSNRLYASNVRSQKKSLNVKLKIPDKML
jgi:hypothetical protein